jgi:hypothetical protein
MGANFSQKDIDRIGQLLEAEKSSHQKDHFRLKISNAEEKRILVLEIYPEVDLGSKRGSLVVVYTGNSHLQMHNCTGYVVSQELGEVTFVAESAGKLSGLVVERGASCSMYASINRELISSDFSALGVEVMLSGVAMSLAEEILEDDGADKK